MTNDKQQRPGVPVPPRSLVLEWTHRRTTSVYEDMADAAAWGADEQLRLCLEWLNENYAGAFSLAESMKRALRPKPPSLKQQALAAHARCSFGKPGDRDIVGAALESLPDD
jgi:hypothetical protein